MSEGNEYEFRVLAINKGGESEYSPSSASVLAKTRFIKPKINLTSPIGVFVTKLGNKIVSLKTKMCPKN